MAGERAEHVPVLTRPLLELLAPRPGECVLDLTVGLGGHALLLADAIGADGTLLAIDVDTPALEGARQRLAQVAPRLIIDRENFARFGEFLDRVGPDRVDVMLADLGVSSMQLADTERGFAFAFDGPLDMRMDDRLPRTAADVINAARPGELADLIFHHSQERASRRIAKEICRRRRERRITRTSQLVEAVCAATGIDPRSRRGRIHPATRTFQALRMFVNDELGNLRAMLEQAPLRLRPGGRLGVISFHSLEDGLVKHDFRRRAAEGVYRIVTRKPVTADAAERAANPRSRSAKLRVAERTAESCAAPGVARRDADAGRQ